LLGIKIEDLELGSKGTLTIHRRPDDPDDPRQDKPATKTAARVLQLSGRLAQIIHEWVLHHRSKIPGAQQSPFLIVSSKNGNPMSTST
jgi:hypothetical protein